MKLRHRFRSRWDKWALRRGNRAPERNITLFILLLALGGNVLPTALGLQPLPGSLDNTVPGVLARGSCSLVVIGCLVSDLGIMWLRRDTGLALEIGGKVVLGVGLLVYSYALWDSVTASNRAYIFAMSFGLALGCFARAIQILLYVHGRRLRSEQEQELRGSCR